MWYTSTMTTIIPFVLAVILPKLKLHTDIPWSRERQRDETNDCPIKLTLQWATPVRGVMG
jgi:hypothetical protein